MDEFEVEWIPEDTGAPYTEVDMTSTEPEAELTTSQIDRICKNKYGHTNWVRMGRITPIELAGNPHFLDSVRGIVFFKKPHRV
jgi:hypothetical protein